MSEKQYICKNSGVVENTVGLMRDLNCKEGLVLDFTGGEPGLREALLNAFEGLSFADLAEDGGSMETEDEQKALQEIEKVVGGHKVAAALFLGIEKCEKASCLLNLAEKLSSQNGNFPIILSASNIAHKDIAMKLLEGRFDYLQDGLIQKGICFYTSRSLDELAEKAGLKRQASNDIEVIETEQHFPEESSILAEGTMIHEYLEWLTKTINPSSEVSRFVRAYVPASSKKVETEEKRPFLTVVTRTQGRRPEALNETFLCLTGQSDTDFELLVMGHNLSEEQNQLVSGMIEDLPQWLREKTRLIPVQGGTRTTPLNAGFAAARGQYIAILDDDDIVFDNWVEGFRTLAKEHSGAVLHGYTIVQDWMTIETPEGVDGLRAVDAPSNKYCREYNHLNQLVVNHCPPVGLAFPAYAFQELGIHFDETMTTTEDWDYMMRVIFLCGAATYKTPFCIYRWWTNSESSQTLHSKKEWDINYRRIKDKFNETPLILPKGSAAKLASMQEGDSTAFQKLNEEEVTLYYNLGGGYSEGCTIPAVKSENPEWVFQFVDFSQKGEIASLRFDPSFYGFVTVEEMEILVITKNGDELLYKGKQLLHNGHQLDDRTVIFVKSDPQFIINFKSPVEINEVFLRYHLKKRISDQDLDQVIRFKGIKQRMKRWLRGILNKGGFSAKLISFVVKLLRR